MTLRRCDSLPTRLRETPVPAGSDPRPQQKKTPDSTAAPSFTDTPDRDQVIATWKSLYTDVKKIKNGFPSTHEPPNQGANKKESITRNFIPNYAYNNRTVRRKITYDNRQVQGGQDVDRSSSFPLDPRQANAAERGEARKKTLLQRLLSWRTPECDCREKYIPKNRPTLRVTAEDLLCTCGASAVRFKPPKKTIQFAERGRSKSVGYEAAREVTQFRRCASAGATVGTETAAALRARAALTLARRYYPEGGWGWTVTVVGTLVQVLSHGLQLGGGPGAIACTAAVKFRVHPLYTHEKMDERRITKEIYKANLNGAGGRGRPRRTYRDQIENILQKGQVESTFNRRACIKAVMKVDEVKEVCQDHSKWKDVVSAYLHGKQVKVTLFKAYCQAFYTSHLWYERTKKAYHRLRVQYNNAFRAMLNLRWRCSASGMFADNEVDDFFTVMRRSRAAFQRRLINCNNLLITSVFRTIYMARNVSNLEFNLI